MPETAAPEFAAERGTDDFAPAGATFAAESPQSDLSDKRETVQLEPVAYDDLDEVEGEAYAAGRRDASSSPSPSSSPESDADRDLAAEAISAARSGDPDEYAWRRPEPAHAEAAAGAAAGADVGADFDLDLGEAEEDDPADEPLPQKVSPTDAVRVARLDAEVLVVDGRPRYHLPDCPHLIGRLTEPIPVNEAVELGFSPCGLCRPVDRLVAAAARH
nr:hypothetical protein [Actinoplanes globisporus]